MEEISIHRQNKAKEIVDTLFEKNVFNQSMTRNDLQSVEDLIAFYIQSEYNSAKRSEEIKLEFKKL